MFLHEPIYDLDELSRCNLHMHTYFSRCANKKMTPSSIIEEAEKSGLEMIAITDHILFPDEIEEHIEHNNLIFDEIQKTGTKIKVLMGGEFSAYGVDKYTLKDSNCKFDYRLYSANHYHNPGWEHPDEKSPEAYKEHMKKILLSLFKDKAADCIAHPIYGRFSARFLDKKYTNEVPVVGKAWSDNEIGDIMVKGFESECAWEINVGAVLGDPEFFRRMFNIGREAGVVFNLGTDAHELVEIDTKTQLDEIKRILL